MDYLKFDVSIEIMKPKRIILIRHGESEGNIDSSIYGTIPDYALKLTSNGHQQAIECGKKLKELIQNESAMFYVSPFWRTRETFENIVSQLDLKELKYREEPRIREQEWGHLRDEKERNQVMKDRDAYGTFYFRIPDGESCADVYDRVTTFLDTLHRDFNKPNYPDNAILVIHGMTIRLFLMRWFQWTVEEFERLSNPANCSIVILSLQKNGKYLLKTEMKKHTVSHKYQREIKI